MTMMFTSEAKNNSDAASSMDRGTGRGGCGGGSIERLSREGSRVFWIIK